MRIINPELIGIEEKLLMVSIKTMLNIDTIQQFFQETTTLKLYNLSDLDDGDITIFENQIAFRLGFSGKISFSILIDRFGDYIGFSNQHHSIELEEKVSKNQINLYDSQSIKEKEEEVIRTISNHLDKNLLRDLFEKKYKLGLKSKAAFKNGYITIQNSTPAYQLEYEGELNFYLFVSRNGDLLSLVDSEAHQTADNGINEEDIRDLIMGLPSHEENL